MEKPMKLTWIFDLPKDFPKEIKKLMAKDAKMIMQKAIKKGE